MPGNVMNSYIRLIQVLLISVFVITAFVCGCSGQREKLVGKYTAVNTNTAGSVTASLELLADGKGFWSIDTDNAAFRWDLHRNKIRLHTRSGGVIEGTIDETGIQFVLPGMGKIRFKK
ncbi:hypothetical protein [Desulfobacula toluolica]|uniref:Conserved uncharacterized protein n=1 Tax=Desulfobacula toluolica (strain DSM 7467 / Tol2) TaxID=651182 RepID=K0NQC6_DESTT|nr:hypothetical protein [Desulfobacula toluolica]CCK81092.1 conserved uncharacterized protein [Desulfobacula toluolica Tol2]